MHREEKEWRCAAARWAGKAVGGGPIPRRVGDGDEWTRGGGGRAWLRGRWEGELTDESHVNRGFSCRPGWSWASN